MIESQSMRVFYCFLAVSRIGYLITVGPDRYVGLDGFGHDTGADTLWQGEFYVHLIKFFGQLLAA